MEMDGTICHCHVTADRLKGAKNVMGGGVFQEKSNRAFYRLNNDY